MKANHSKMNTVSCPVLCAKTAISFGFTNAARFFSALRFYFYGFYPGNSSI